MYKHIWPFKQYKWALITPTRPYISNSFPNTTVEKTISKAKMPVTTWNEDAFASGAE